MTVQARKEQFVFFVNKHMLDRPDAVVVRSQKTEKSGCCAGGRIREELFWRDRDCIICALLEVLRR